MTRSPSRRDCPSGLWLLPLLCLLAACGGGSERARTDAYSPGSASYPEPGPPGDPWRPYIRDASGRFSVPQAWIRAVMHEESGGHEYRDGRPIISGAGAMGLMQLMPATYADLQAQYGLGNDPFEPHDNILAGTAYISQMYRKYGAPGFLAAYNAGPQRLDDYVLRGRRLPNETENYVASIAPHLGTEIAMSGPLASYASSSRYGGGSYAPVRLAAYQVAPRHRSRGGACWHDPDAAYDPTAPCQTPPAAPIRLAMAPPSSARCPDDPDAAFDQACPPAAPRPLSYPAPSYPVRTQSAVVLASVPVRPATAYGGWAIQVGAYNTVDQARFATTMARQTDFARLAGSQSVVQPTTPFGRATLYRARLAGLARADAGQACASLSAHGIPCMVVTPGG